MNCDSLEQLWQNWLDQPSGPSPALDAEAEAHRAQCPACRRRSAGFLSLATALGSAREAPRPSADFADRVLRRFHAERKADIRRRTWRRWGTLAAAAALAISSGVGIWISRSGTVSHPSQVVVDRPAQEPVRLTEALAAATSATIELALESSAPAARLGREVLGSTARVQPPSAEFTNPVEASEALEDAGRRLTSGVSPLSQQAQRAFGFLLGPASSPEEPEVSVRDGA
ncbi:MAG TPA: hypothetical protein VFT74_21190 [Isosphaeraceae bacterium]|nr:hypothetical protein [Isosphaeraceae bacterium]